MFFVALLLLFGQQSAIADSRPSHRDDQAKRVKNAHSQRNAQFEYRFDNRRDLSPPTYQHYYKPSHRVNPLPHGYSRIFVNAAEYFFYDGFFYRPYRNGYVIVEAPLGAIVATLPRLHHIFRWHGEPYYVIDNTFYRKHPRGYIVVPNPGYDYRR